MLYKWIYKIGQRMRNPSIDSHYTFLKQSEKWELEALEAYQLKKLKELLIFAYDKSPYYRKLFEKQQFNPKDFHSLKDLKKIPITTKKDAISFNKEIHTDYPFKKLFTATSSGSSGDSLSFQRDEKADSFNRASIFRGYSWHGVKPWDRNGYLWGFNFNLKERIKVKILDFFQNRFRMFTYSDHSFLHFIKKLNKAKYLHGYASMIYQIAKMVNGSEIKKPKGIRMVKGTSEKIFDHYKEEVLQAFNVPLVSEYGATESGIIAFECPEGTMHINMEGVMVEEEDHEIVVTHLHMKSFPVIRYRLGDYIQLAPRSKKCSCGMQHLILEEVTGRVGETVYGIEAIYPSLYFYYIFKNLKLTHSLALNYHVVQKEKGNLDFYIEETLNLKENALLKKEIEKYFKKDMDYKIHTNIKKETASEKKKSFKSYI